MAANTHHKIILINPNTTQSMTDALKPLVDKLGYSHIAFTFWTAPTGLPSINNEEDEETSTKACLDSIPLITSWRNFDAYLICCYSAHPLVGWLRQLIPGKPIVGIFEASIAYCLQALNFSHREAETFGIVSTGRQWEEIHRKDVKALLGTEASGRYVGVESTGLSASELHSTDEGEVQRRMKEATKRLLEKGVKGVCLGCAGMAGMDRVVRETCVEVLGERRGNAIKVVDGVMAGVVFLEGALRTSF